MFYDDVWCQLNSWASPAKKYYKPAISNFIKVICCSLMAMSCRQAAPDINDSAKSFIVHCFMFT